MEACDCTTFHWPSSRAKTPVIRTGRSRPPAVGGHGGHDLLARPPLIGVGADVNGIGTLREPGPYPLRIARVLRLEQPVKHHPDFILRPGSGHGLPLTSARYRAVR